jgi:hypothetical protein
MTPLQLYEVTYFLRNKGTQYNNFLMSFYRLDPFEHPEKFIGKRVYIDKFVRPEWIYKQLEGLGWETRYDRS